MIRASSLPKLAVCGQYESSPGTSDAAARGTRIDSLVRRLWTTGEYLDREQAADEIEAARWVIGQFIALSQNRAPVLTTEADCKIYVPVIEYTGTMDAVCPRQRWLADIKSGQVRNYREQMAAYALGCMAEHIEQEWTTHLLFCDQQRVVSETFTFREARDIVAAAAGNVGKSPTVNDYCGWCAKSLTCPARMDAAGAVMTATASALPVEQDQGFLAMLADPERLGQFLTRCKTFDDFREAAEAKARELLAAGGDVPGWRLQKPRVSEYVNSGDVMASVEDGILGISDVIEAYGSMSASRARKLWSAAGAVFPENAVKIKTGAAPLVANKRNGA